MQSEAVKLNREMLRGVTAEEIRAGEDILLRMKKTLIAMDAELKKLKV